jgi:uncharacterized lipoprotein YmbA
MTPLLRRRLLLALGTTAALAGCASPNPLLYTLAAVPGATRTGAPHTIELRAIALARYLERSQIVRSSEGYRLEVLGDEWWGEPLDAMLSRVLVQDLTQRLPGASVFAENGAITATADATVELNLQRLDEDATGAVVLVAQVAVRHGNHPDQTRNVRFAVRPQGPTTGAMVAAMSIATGQLADVMAGMLTGR